MTRQTRRPIERAVATILDALGEAERVGAAFARIADTTMAWALVPPTNQMSQGVLDGMLTTGRLHLIRDGELRTALSAWEGVADLTEDEVASRELVMAQLDPLLWRLMDVRAIRSYELLLGAPSHAMAATSEVPADRELIGILATRRYWQHHTMREFSGLARRPGAFSASSDDPWARHRNEFRRGPRAPAPRRTPCRTRTHRRRARGRALKR